ncbi:MAG: hypothetical protein Ta2B_15200 [Termitinemataceae bacterium]|nr:MAG: hypothetical protein Ta2B_15200 [Termitinemataceae bacterium]
MKLMMVINMETNNNVIHFKTITNDIFIPAMRKLGFMVRKTTKVTQGITFYYDGIFANVFIVDKIPQVNAVKFLMSRKEKNELAFPCNIMMLALVRGDEKIKKIFEDRFSDLYFDNDDELVGIYDFVYGLLRENISDFYYGNLKSEMIENYQRVSRTGIVSDNDNSSKVTLLQNYEKHIKWEETVRFLGRRYL